MEHLSLENGISKLTFMYNLLVAGALWLLWRRVLLAFDCLFQTDIQTKLYNLEVVYTLTFYFKSKEDLCLS